MSNQYDVAIVGGGIVGLAHAWRAATRGLRVVLFERQAVAQGASVRNFGMIWPIGQPAGELYELALRSRGLWLELGETGVLDVDSCGSLHLAHHDDELAVLEEFCHRGEHRCEMLTAAEVVSRSPLANPDALHGGMASPTELRVDPRTASAKIAQWLTRQYPVECRFGTAVTAAEASGVTTADGKHYPASRVIVCSGSDLKTLLPEDFARSQLQLCKLQMLKVTHPGIAAATPHLASGLTLRHYTSFRSCPSLGTVRNRVADHSPELDRYGIHVMASAFANGDVILGDSHEYGAAVTPFDNPQIDDLMLRELRHVIRLPDWTVRQRWHGIYSKHPTLPVYDATADNGVHLFVGTGGAGMTMAFGLAERTWQRWTGETS